MSKTATLWDVEFEGIVYVGYGLKVVKSSLGGSSFSPVQTLLLQER